MSTPSRACRAFPPATLNRPLSHHLPLSCVLRLFSLLLITLGWTPMAFAQVVLNEIMYRPGTGYPEITGLEFIEIHNPTAQAVDLSGWALTSGVSFVFPGGAVIPAGGYRVIGANPALLQSTYWISGVLGPWGAGATLANGGE